ncbi:hypothetical protein DEO72_LG6g1099 [Vigna unguiculata]|uniref:Uncharacterized protein n=1 Tax=Vigna unguiculata TaxID=3917 RepID=A0A4D6M6A5_VIGUN|nr:hypothetical protein DEO72_LG6g1099 [Vigna unguiculata]
MLFQSFATKLFPSKGSKIVRRTDPKQCRTVTVNGEVQRLWQRDKDAGGGATGEGRVAAALALAVAGLASSDGAAVRFQRERDGGGSVMNGEDEACCRRFWDCSDELQARRRQVDGSVVTPSVKCGSWHGAKGEIRVSLGKEMMTWARKKIRRTDPKQCRTVTVNGEVQRLWQRDKDAGGGATGEGRVAAALALAVAGLASSDGAAVRFQRERDGGGSVMNGEDEACCRRFWDCSDELQARRRQVDGSVVTPSVKCGSWHGAKGEIRVSLGKEMMTW